MRDRTFQQQDALALPNDDRYQQAD